MAPTITYDGVLGGQGGNIFKDHAFWVSQRVPTRNSVIEKITNNGGSIVPLEKQATVLIDDHLRKKIAAPNSYSWKFITESVQHGALQLLDRYLIGPNPDLPRPAGGSRPVKQGRSAFEKNDDAVLARWALSHSSARTGNKIYQELEKINPRHTWQAWRNRYVKKLSQLHPNELEQLASRATDDVPPEPEIHAAPSTRIRPTIPPSTTSTVRESPAESIAPVITVRGENDEETPDPANAENYHDDDLQDEEIAFYHDLEVYLERAQLENKFAHRFGSKTVEMWPLLLSVQGQKVPCGEVDWIKVAEELGYSWDEAQSVKDELRACYEELLVPFIEATDVLSGDEEEVSGSVGDFEERPEATATVEESGSPRPFYPSSPPTNISGRKRSLDDHVPASSRHGKRRRLSPNAEIPSTPERILDSPQRDIVTNQQALSRGNGTVQRSRAEDNQGSQQLPPLPRPLTKIQPEPETQDFNFAMGESPARLTREESTFDITPSQQLHSEDLDASSIPFSLNTGKSHDKTPSPATRPNPVQARSKSLHGVISSQSASAERPTASRTATEPTQSKQAKKRTLPANFNSSPSSKPLTQANSSSAKPQSPIKPVKPSTGNRNFDEINEWLLHYESLGYDKRFVIEALKSTTMSPGGLAGLVMQSLKEGKGIPSNYEGVWTDRDDKSLRVVMSADSKPSTLTEPEQALQANRAKKNLNRLLDKHGQERIEVRKRFLTDQENGEGGILSE